MINFRFRMHGFTCRAVHIQRNSHLENAVEQIEAQQAPDAAAYVGLLRQCSKERALQPGKRIHAQIVKHRLEHDQFLVNLIVQMYGKCGSVQEAKLVFDKMPRRNVFSWGIMITTYAQNGHPQNALDLFTEMDRQSLHADGVIYVSLLAACSSTKQLETGKYLHRRIVLERIEIDSYLGTALINMYGKCGCSEHAWSVFHKLPKKDVVMWNAMLAAYAQNGQSQEAVNLYYQMKPAGMKANEVTLVSVLDACADIEALEEGRRVHSYILTHPEFRLGGSMGNALVNLYGKCGKVEEARNVFDILNPRTVVSWTSMISAYAQNGHNEKALAVYHEMDMKPNTVTYVSVLQACANMKSVEDGERIHERIVSNGLDMDISVANTLVDMYGKCGDVHQAKVVFDEIYTKNVVSWNVMLTAYAQNGHNLEALHLLWTMENEGIHPNSVTFASVLGACKKVAEGRGIHNRIFLLGFQSNIVVGTALVTMYGKLNKINEARNVFNELITENVISWNALMSVYIENGDGKSALEMLHKMLGTPNMKPDVFTFVNALEACTMLGDIRAGQDVHERAEEYGYDVNTMVANALITMYGRCGCVTEAREVLEKTCKRDIVSWSAMLAAYAQNGHYKEVLKLYRRFLVDGMKPEGSTFLPVLEACAFSLGVVVGKAVHGHIRETGLKTDILDSSLVNMYGKCGNLDVAMSIFETMKVKDSITWTTMMLSNARQGHISEALEVYYRMQLEGVHTDGVTLGCLVSSCGHAGNVKDGWEYFVSAVQDYNACPTFEHYTVMCDLLSRSGRLEEAEELLRNMPYEPGLVSWRCLLSACANHGNVNVGKRAADCIFELSPGDPPAYVLLSNIYSKVGMTDEAEKLRNAHHTRDYI